MRSHSQITLSAAIVALCAPFALADFDFKPSITNNQIVTGGHDDEQGIDTPSLRLSTYAFNQTPGDPYNVGDPGFTTAGASPFSPSSTLRLIPLPIDGSYLLYWDGTGSPSFSPAPANASLSLAASHTRYVTFSPSSISYSPASPAGLLIGTFSANGALHVHLTSSLFFNNDQTDDSIPPGAYLLSFSLTNPSTGILDSAPLFLLYNNDLPDPTFYAAADYALTTYTPEPASLSLLSLTPLSLCRRRR